MIYILFTGLESYWSRQSSHSEMIILKLLEITYNTIKKKDMIYWYSFFSVTI